MSFHYSDWVTDGFILLTKLDVFVIFLSYQSIIQYNTRAMNQKVTRIQMKKISQNFSKPCKNSQKSQKIELFQYCFTITVQKIAVTTARQVLILKGKTKPENFLFRPRRTHFVITS
jgi:hypothetical protein